MLTYFISVPGAGDVIAGVQLTVNLLKTIVKSISDVKRKVAIGIENKTGYHWKALNVYFRSGTSDATLPFSVPSGKNEFIFPCQTNFQKFSIRFQGSKFFNSLSEEIQGSESIGLFGKGLKIFLLTNSHKLLKELQTRFPLVVVVFVFRFLPPFF